MPCAQRSTAAGILVVACALSAFASPAARAASFNLPQDVTAITAIEMKASGETNVDKLAPYFAPDAIVADYTAPGWYEGQSQIHDAYVPQLAAVKSVKFHMDEMNIASDGKLACAATLIHFNATMKDNASVSLSVRQLDAFKKIDGKWHLIQQHVSVPVDEKTGAAIMNGPLTARGKMKWEPGAFAGSAQAPDVGKADIRKWLEGNIVPTKLDDAIQTYGPSDDLIVFDVGSLGEHRGLGELRSYLGPLLEGVHDIQYKIPAFAAEADGVLGMQISKLDLKINMKDGKTQYMSFRQSDCLRRVGDKWYSFLEMGSFPVDAKTGKAVMANPGAFQ